MLMTTTYQSFLTVASPAADIERYAGNKGKSLFALGRAGLHVPPWAIVGANFFAAFRRDSGLDARIGEMLQTFTPEQAGRISREIVDAIIGVDMSSALCEKISQALIHLGDGPLAVRSSGMEEDGTQFSFAGQFDTYLGVQGV